MTERHGTKAASWPRPSRRCGRTATRSRGGAAPGRAPGAEGVTGSFCNGTTGEGESLTPEERSRGRRGVREGRRRPACASFVQVGANSLRVAQELAAHAAGSARTPSRRRRRPTSSPRRVTDPSRASGGRARGSESCRASTTTSRRSPACASTWSALLRQAGEAIAELRRRQVQRGGPADLRGVHEVRRRPLRGLWGSDETLLTGLAAGATAAIGSTYCFAAPAVSEGDRGPRAGDSRPRSTGRSEQRPDGRRPGAPRRPAGVQGDDAADRPSTAGRSRLPAARPFGRRGRGSARRPRGDRLLRLGPPVSRAARRRWRRRASLCSPRLLRRRETTPRPASPGPPLPSLPDGVGVAGSCAGVSGGALVVAGGANFPERATLGGPRQGVARPDLRAPRAGRRVADRGDAAAAPAGLRRGADVERSSSVPRRRRRRTSLPRLLRPPVERAAVEIEPLPPLPTGLAFAAGALLDDTVFVAGGLEAPDARSAVHTAWSLDLTARGGAGLASTARRGPGRLVTSRWPGPGRVVLPLRWRRPAEATPRAGPNGCGRTSRTRSASPPDTAGAPWLGLPRPVAAAPARRPRWARRTSRCWEATTARVVAPPGDAHPGFDRRGAPVPHDHRHLGRDGFPGAQTRR